MMLVQSQLRENNSSLNINRAFLRLYRPGLTLRQETFHTMSTTLVYAALALFSVTTTTLVNNVILSMSNGTTIKALGDTKLTYLPSAPESTSDGHFQFAPNAGTLKDFDGQSLSSPSCVFMPRPK